MPSDFKPQGYHTITPFIVVRGAEDYMAFLARAFDAEEADRTMSPDGLIVHAAMRIGDSTIELSDVRADLQPTPSHLHVYVPDVDEAHKKALEAGGKAVMAPSNRPYGDRESTVRDRWGNEWYLATHVEDVSPQEMAKRMAALQKPK